MSKIEGSARAPHLQRFILLVSFSDNFETSLSALWGLIVHVPVETMDYFLPEDNPVQVVKGLTSKIESSARAPRFLRFILLISFSDTLLANLILAICSCFGSPEGIKREKRINTLQQHLRHTNFFGESFKILSC